MANSTTKSNNTTKKKASPSKKIVTAKPVYNIVDTETNKLIKETKTLAEAKEFARNSKKSQLTIDKTLFIVFKRPE